MTTETLVRPPCDLYITDALAKRPVHKADYLQEKQALQALAQRMLNDPGNVLPHFVDLAMQMAGGVSAGLSLLEIDPPPAVFRWRYLTGSLKRFENATTPRNFSPCGITLDQNAPVLSRHPERFYDWISDAGIVVPEVLLVPLYLGGEEPLGTLWIVAASEGHFDSGHARIATELASFAGIALKMLKTGEELQNALEQQETLTKEMSHRVKNLFAIAEGMVRTGLRTSTSKEDLGETLVGRFHALAGAHGLIRRSFSANPDGAHPDNIRVSDFSSLIRTIVRPHERPEDSRPRFSLDGPALALGERAINGMALIFHELATNSLKHGAARADDGQIEIVWTAEGEDLKVAWKERGGPRLDSAPSTTGYGSKLLNDTIRIQFNGKLSHDWHKDGLIVSLDIPIRYLAS